jgi:hypothetical protein
MKPRFKGRSGMALLLVILIAGVPGAARTQERSTTDAQLRSEIELLKEQLRRIEQQMKQQEDLIRRLSAPPPAPQPPVAAPAPASPAPGATAPALTTADIERLRLRILEDLQPQLAAANKTFPSQFNPAIGFIVDAVASNKRRSFQNFGHDTGNFEFRSGELGLSANVDPFARIYAIINGTPDGVDVEEAAIVTTSLPWNLTVKGGRFFAEFGRLSTFHDHDLPFVNRPVVLDRYIGGESQADGIELSWLVPLPQYLTLTLGAYNKIGADNDRVDNLVPRDWLEFTYLGRAHTFFSLSDAHSLDVGVSNAYTPEVRNDDRQDRNVFGVDLTYRYAPLAAAAYRGLVLGTEFLVNSETRPSDSTVSGFKHRSAWGLYSYFEARLTRRYYVGFLFEHVNDIDPGQRFFRAYSPYLTIWASEFQRLRLQYTRVESPVHDDQFFLQWTAIIGSHVHSFRDR